MEIRTSKPNNGNKFYVTSANDGYSRCIQGFPMDNDCNVLSNCVGYACGRFNEIIGSMKYPYLNCNAENFVDRAKSTYGLSVAPYPTLGGIMVWRYGSLSGNDGAGHVAIVERIDNSNQIYTSESGYGGSAFWNSLRTNNNGRWGLGNGYVFIGCIINPAIGDVHYIEPIEPVKPTNYTTGIYKLIVSKYLRKNHNLSENYVLVNETTQAMRSALTSNSYNDKARIKVGRKITILEVFTDSENRVWGRNYNGWVVMQNKDGTPQMEKSEI